MIFVDTPRASSAAPVPRPPQPTSPMRIGSSGAAGLVVTKGNSLKAAAPATGSHRLHKEEQEKIINDAFSL